MKKCSKCKLNPVVGKRSSYCGICNSLFTRKRSTALKQKCIEYKGGKCCKCGYNKYLGALEFHHLNPLEKKFTFAKKMHLDFEVLRLELDKCELVCVNCHREIDDQYGYLVDCSALKTTNKKNTFTKERDKKLCNRCDCLKDLKEFYFLKSYNRYVSSCRDCHKKIIVLKRNKRKQEWVEYKGGKCCKCGYNKCLSALEFHHINPNDKLFTFSDKKSVSKKTDEELRLELDKCDLLCANCHREIENTIREDKYKDYLHLFE